jgi:hypothetical protein
MFTVEFEADAAVITTLDENDAFDDVQVVIGDDETVYMRQFSEELEEHQLLYMSYQQFLDIVAALNKTKGMYYVERT